MEKLKNAQLKQALSTFIKDTRNEEPSNSVLLDELRISTIDINSPLQVGVQCPCLLLVKYVLAFEMR